MVITWWTMAFLLSDERGTRVMRGLITLVLNMFIKKALSFKALRKQGPNPYQDRSTQIQDKRSHH